MRKLLCPVHLEVKPYFRRQRAGCHVVSSAEGGKKVVKGHFVGYVDGGESQAPLVTVSTEQVVFAHRYVEQIARRNTGRILVVVFRPWRRNSYVLGTVASCRTEVRAGRRTDRRRGSRKYAPAEKSRLELLIWRQSGHINQIKGPTAAWPVRARLASEARKWTSHKPAVVPPVEADKWPSLPRLVLQVRCLVELFVVVDAKY